MKIYREDDTLDVHVPVRMFPEEVDRINNTIKSKRKYESVSHFIRCAVERLLKEEEENEV